MIVCHEEPAFHLAATGGFTDTVQMNDFSESYPFALDSLSLSLSLSLFLRLSVCLSVSLSLSLSLWAVDRIVWSISVAQDVVPPTNSSNTVKDVCVFVYVCVCVCV